ncbi:MAG: DNA polymerase III subunit alpha [Salinivirgaceae bacterium]
MYLNCHSYYSLRYGTLSVDDLVTQAAALKIKELVLSDINNTSGMPDFVKACLSHGIKPIAGIEFRNRHTFLYLGIARNNEGLEQLNRFLSTHLLEQTPLPERAPQLSQAYFIYPFGRFQPNDLLPNEFTGIRVNELNKLWNSKYALRTDKLVALHPLTFKDDKGYYLHQNLRAIDDNTLITKVKPESLAQANEKWIDPHLLGIAYSDYPEIGKNTRAILDDCFIDFDFTSTKNKQVYSGSRYDDKQLLEKLAFDGMEYRYGKNNPIARQRVTQELEVIHKLGFSAYFLITWDLVRYAMSRGFYHVGRGSGANSVVAYCLRITDVDPIELNLYFERFINPKRTSPPDFDIDFSWKERDQVQDYLFKRYGREHTALLGTINTFKGKSIYRELGKVHGLPKDEIDAFIDRPTAYENQNEITRRIIKIGALMQDFPNLRSIHAGGVLVSEESIFRYTALDMPPKGFPTTQWDMYVAEDLGFEKLDILSQRGIGHIRECVELVKANQGIDIDIHQVEAFKTNPQVKQQLKKGEAIGCFYIESPAMRGLLKKLQCDDYLRLVAASSIIRPGVAKSGMMKEYIKRFHNPEGFKYIHPVMKEQLEETYGVMVYQEDVLKVCHHFAGLDLADADILRRAMSGKHRSHAEFKRIEQKFFANCRERAYPDAITNEVWRQIESFAGYSFSKAHSASYAVESFQSLYLKSYFPLEFMVAVINNFGGFYQTWVYFSEARYQGANINLPHINHSQYLTSINKNEVYIGFIHIARLEQQVAYALIEERKKNGPFRSLVDFVNRVHIGIEQLILLIRIGAFRFTEKDKVSLLWEAHMYLKKEKPKPKPKALFELEEPRFEMPQLEHQLIEDAYDEIELIDFPVSMSYFEMLETPFRGEIKARQMLQHVGKKVRMMGLLVTLKYVWTSKKEIMHFGTFFDDEGEFFDSVNFPPSLKQYPFTGRGVYLILGKITQEFGQPSIEVEKMVCMPQKPDPRSK